MATKKYNVAIIGYGLSAKVFHIPLVLAVPELKLYGIVQRSPGPENDASKDHPGVKCWRSVEEAYGDEEVNVVVVTSTPGTHFEMCKSALEAGKHVVVEKPFVPTAKEADGLIDIAKRNKKLLTVYQNRRWDADFLTLRQLLSDGTLGEIAEFETHFDRHRPEPPPQTWKVKDAPGHGSLHDLGSHMIDQVYHLFGMPQRVTGFIGNQRRNVSGESSDSHTALLHYDGILVTVKAAVVSPEEEQLRFWVRGTRGSFKKFHMDVQEAQLRQGRKPGDEGFGVDPENQYGVLTTVEGGSPKRRVYPTVQPLTYAEFYRLFVKALQGRGEVPVKAEEARDVLHILDVTILSSQEGRTIAL